MVEVSSGGAPRLRVTRTLAGIISGGGTPLPRSPISIFGHAKGAAASLPSSPLGPPVAAEDTEFSVPLLIVGNKIDKLSRADRSTLQTACAQQVFVVS